MKTEYPNCYVSIAKGQILSESQTIAFIIDGEELLKSTID